MVVEKRPVARKFLLLPRRLREKPLAAIFIASDGFSLGLRRRFLGVLF